MMVADDDVSVMAHLGSDKVCDVGCLKGIDMLLWVTDSDFHILDRFWWALERGVIFVLV